MRWILCVAAAIIAWPDVCSAQTEGTPAIAREVFSREVQKAARPVIVEERVVVPPRIVTERTVRERVPPVVVERPIVRERVVVTPTPAPWWDVLIRGRYGYYDDAYFDDNWYYDYYDGPEIRAVDGELRYRTGWLYAPTAERGMFNW